ncbi:MAG: ATP/GTP-binding protein [Halobacteria archaeon]
MEDNIRLYLVGTAGSGKSTFTKALLEWMDAQKYPAFTVNLDPGAERLPYTPDVDVRDWVKLSDVMNRYSVGPNGGQILAADMIALHAEEIRRELDSLRADYFLMDTPGQIELFAFRESSRLLVEALGGPNLLAFLYDPLLARQPAGFVSLALLACSVQFRFAVPSVTLLGKSDLLKPEERARIESWAADGDLLREALEGAGAVSTELFKALDSIGAFGAPLPVSGATGEGAADLYTAVQEIYMGGEDIVRE